MDETESMTVELPLAVRGAEVRSFDVEKRTAEMVFSTGARVMRSDFWTGERWIEELSLDPSHVRLDRVRSGAVPFLKDHGGWAGAGIDDVLGRVIEASVDGKQGVGTVQFSNRDSVKPYVKDIEEGILRSVSVGYAIHKMEKVGEENGVPVLRATDWEVFEVSSVAMPADSAAQFRSVEDEKKAPRLFRCQVRGLRMGETGATVDPVEKTVESESTSKQTQTTGESESMNEAEIKAAAEAARKEGAKLERERQVEIRKMVRVAKLEEAFAEELIADESVTVDAARSKVIDALAAKDAATPTRSVRIESGAQDEVKTRREGMTDAILHRGAPETYKVSEKGREWAGLTLIEMARESLRRSGVSVNHLSRTEIAERAMHSTSDFPEVTAAAVNKSLRDAFLAAPQTFSPFTKRVQNPDFKEMSRVQLGLGSGLAEIAEGGEVTYGSVGEAAEKYSIKEYAKALSISRKAMVNDDLSAFVRIPAQMGAKARSLESDLVWGVLTANAAMADGIALFHASHGNLAGAGSVISVASLGAARAALRAQTEMDGEKLNLPLQWLAVPVALETVAEQYVSQLQPNLSSAVNPFAPGGRTPLQIIVEPRLDTASAISWYGMSGLGQVDMLELATLSGSSEPEVIMEEGFDVLGMKFRVVHSVGVKAIDWRGLYKNPGA